MLVMSLVIAGAVPPGGRSTQSDTARRHALQTLPRAPLLDPSRPSLPRRRCSLRTRRLRRQRRRGTKRRVCTRRGMGRRKAPKLARLGGSMLAWNMVATSGYTPFSFLLRSPCFVLLCRASLFVCVCARACMCVRLVRCARVWARPVKSGQ